MLDTLKFKHVHLRHNQLLAIHLPENQRHCYLHYQDHHFAVHDPSKRQEFGQILGALMDHAPQNDDLDNEDNSDADFLEDGLLEAGYDGDEHA